MKFDILKSLYVCNDKIFYKTDSHPRKVGEKHYRSFIHHLSKILLNNKVWVRKDDGYLGEER